jgi:hypothetical protein
MPNAVARSLNIKASWLFSTGYSELMEVRILFTLNDFDRAKLACLQTRYTICHISGRT